jgi:hypothetical protein
MSYKILKFEYRFLLILKHVLQNPGGDDAMSDLNFNPWDNIIYITLFLYKLFF